MTAPITLSGVHSCSRCAQPLVRNHDELVCMVHGLQAEPVRAGDFVVDSSWVPADEGDPTRRRRRVARPTDAVPLTAAERGALEGDSGLTPEEWDAAAGRGEFERVERFERCPRCGQRGISLPGASCLVCAGRKEREMNTDTSGATPERLQVLTAEDLGKQAIAQLRLAARQIAQLDEKKERIRAEVAGFAKIVAVLGMEVPPECEGLLAVGKPSKPRKGDGGHSRLRSGEYPCAKCGRMFFSSQAHGTHLSRSAACGRGGGE
ncbi:MAG: hypothetical protein HY873_13295 [Chloroflexi bacterium]|nr:hypothetical protein [Chloroflexota bacterium]